MLRGRWLRLQAVAVLWTLGACSHEVSGPTPEVPEVADNGIPVDPGIICNAQHASTVTLHGSGLSPIPIDIPNDPKTALPSIQLTRTHDVDGSDVATPETVLFSGDPDRDPTNAFADADGGVPLLTWASQEEMAFTVTQQLTLGDGQAGMLRQGVYDVSAQNANGNDAVSVGALAVIDKPTLASTTPGIVCLEEMERTITLAGQTFLTLGGGGPVLQIEGVAADRPTTLTECDPIVHAGIDAELCASATVTLPMNSIPVGYPALTVLNPETAACHSEDEINLRVVPKPTIDRVVPPLACVMEADRQFIIEGAGFLVIDNAVPGVTVAGIDVTVDATDGCVDLETQGHDVRTCTSISITVTQGQIDPGLHPVVVTNPQPAGCSATAVGAVRIVPPPAIIEIVPPLVCVDDGPRDVRVLGTDFLVVDAVVPAVTVDGVVLDPTAISPEGCEDLPVPDLSVQRCTELVVTFAMNGVGVGLPVITVTNPDPAGCSDTRSDLLRVVPGPTIAAAEPALICTDGGARAIVITGTGFLRVDTSTLPTVTIGGTPAVVDSADGCTTLTTNGLITEECTTLNVTVADGSLSEGTPAVLVQNPDPAGCSVSNDTVLVVPPALAITSINPVSACQGMTGVQTVDVQGTGFLIVDGALPVISVGGSAQTLTRSAFSSCVALAVPGFTLVETCQSASIGIDVTGLTAGTTLPVTITNPSPSDCAAASTTGFVIVGAPTIATVAPTQFCTATAATLTITGSNFSSVAQILVGTDCDQPTPTNCFAADPVVVNNSGTNITADFAGLPAGSYSVTVRNAVSCEGTFATPIVVHPTPIVFFVDPPIVYNGITIDATLFTSGLSSASAVDTVELIGPTTAPTPTTTELTVVATPRFNRIIARVPGIDSGTMQPTFPAGEYTVRVTSTLGCIGTLDGAVTVTDSLSNTLLTSIDPSFVSPTVPTAVTVTGTGFLAVPRLYLTPTSGVGTATALRAVQLNGSTQLTAVVPGDSTTPLTAGTYDLVAVNPDGQVDVLTAAVTITTGDPPVIRSVVPASLVASTSGTINVNGENFDADMVELDCKPPTGPNVVIPGVLQGTPTSTDVQVTFNVGASGAAVGSACLVRLTNADGASFDYSAISLTNASLNLYPWAAATDMTVGRRAVSLTAGRPTETSRFLYAVGGDTGAANNTRTVGSVHATVESANVDVFGTMNAWSLQRNDLSTAVVGGAVTAAPRTEAGIARVGRFVYLVGGYEGTSVTATDTLLRAEILDPLSTPTVEDLDAQLGDPTMGIAGLPVGLYYYRVAAVFPDADADNPGGETLGGELFPVQVPARSEGVVLTLTWAPVVGAHGYRIYRSPTANAGVGAMAQLVEQTCGSTGTGICDCSVNPAQCQFTDNGSGSTSTDPLETPMPSGSLGVWHAVDGARCSSGDCQLGTARESHATVSVPNVANPNQHFLYAFGGRDAAGGYLNTYEVATITVASDGSQTVSDWVVGGDTLSSPRAELAAWVMSAENSATIRTSGTPNDIWIYVGGGRTTAGAFDRGLEAGLVQSSGSLSNFTATDGFVGDLAGLGAGASNGQLYTFGGKAGVADGTSAALCAGGGGCGPLPDLQPGAFNSLAGATTQRMYMGYTQESAFFFLSGGHDGATTLSTTQRAVQ